MSLFPKKVEYTFKKFIKLHLNGFNFFTTFLNSKNYSSVQLTIQNEI